jgi:hypothetical protein
MNDIIGEMRTWRYRRPFEPFVIVLKDGRRFRIARPLQFGFNRVKVGVMDDRDHTEFFPASDIVSLERESPATAN